MSVGVILSGACIMTVDINLSGVFKMSHGVNLL